MGSIGPGLKARLFPLIENNLAYHLVTVSTPSGDGSPILLSLAILEDPFRKHKSISICSLVLFLILTYEAGYDRIRVVITEHFRRKPGLLLYSDNILQLWSSGY